MPNLTEDGELVLFDGCAMNIDDGRHAVPWCAHCRDHHTPYECQTTRNCQRRECQPLPDLSRPLPPACTCSDIGAPCDCPAKERA